MIELVGKTLSELLCLILVLGFIHLNHCKNVNQNVHYSIKT